MYSFLVYANANYLEVSPVLGKASRIIQKLTSSMGINAKVTHREIPEVKAGWLFLEPEFVSGKSFISEYVDSRCAVIVFGELYQKDSGTVAENIAKIWRKNGVDAVRRLNGCFSAVIIDSLSNEFYIVSDLVGLRSARYYCGKNYLLVSTHDIPIVATGLCSFEFDLASASSILCYDWSLQSKSLIKGIEACNPNKYITWREGSLKTEDKPLLSVQDRINRHDKKTFSKHIDLMIEVMRNNTRTFCGNVSTVRADLTAGSDTRALLGILLSVIEPYRLKLFTLGSFGSMEVSTAMRIASKYNLRHMHFNHDVPDFDSFIRHVRLRAFLMNGDTNAKRAVAESPSYLNDGAVYLHGGGGPIFKGAYYFNTQKKNFLSGLQTEDIVKFLENRCRRDKTVFQPSEEIQLKIKSRLSDIINNYLNISNNAADLLDLFYLYERYGRWGSMAANFTWENRFCPFDLPEVVKMGFKLPSPISNDCLLHRTIIKRYLPEVYCWPVNKSYLLPLIGSSELKVIAQKVINRVLRFRQRKQYSSNINEDAKSHEQKRSEIFAIFLADKMKDMFLDANSISSTVFKKDILNHIICEHEKRSKNYSRLLGILATVEQFRYLVSEVISISGQELRKTDFVGVSKIKIKK
ncbi:MAG: hypothetical protein JW734_00870 [Candidatus Omnitrophica bacterium]|nr:hypothetical protein [Candidatus Omnitrophota bacterium]